MPRVSAAIPTYNARPERLARAVQSCLAQPEVSRIFVIDDGSTPAAQLHADPRISLHRQSNAGPSAARNRALDLAAAESDFLMFLDDDDVLEPGAIPPALSLATRTGAGAVVSARYERRGNARTLKPVPAEWADRVLPSPGDVFWPIACFGASGLLIRMAALEGLRFDTDLMIGEDRDFLRRLAAGHAIAVSSSAALTVELHENGSNLSSAGHLARRVRDHLIILERHHDAQSDRALRQQTLWLLSALAKNPPLDVQSWNALRSAAALHHWKVPLKPRLRAWRAQRAAHV